MAPSLAARRLPFATHAPRPSLLLLLVLAAAIAPPSSLSTCTPNYELLSSAAQPVNAVPAHAAASTGPTIRPVHGSLGVSVFQTSFDLRVPCLTRVIRPPRFYEPPSRVIIATPTANGTYPVILFKHGFLLANCFYTQLFEFLASSGYIIVAPQAVTASPDCTTDIEETAKVANWVSNSLAVVLTAAVSSAQVVPNISKLVMAGHSRGGKIAFAMALGMSSTEIIPSFSALVTLDPVDGTSSDSILEPPIVAPGCNHTRNHLSVPVVILGAGYGNDTRILGAQPCAPACCSHMAYFNCSSAPIMYHLVASEYGHLDFLDDSQIWTSGLCASGSSKAPLRDFSVELMVAFLEYALEGEEEGMESIIENWESASITLEEPQVYTEDSARVLLLNREHMHDEL